MSNPVTEYIITPHALLEMNRREVPEDVVRTVLTSAEQRETVRVGRDVLQSRVVFAGTIYVVRVFVDVDRNPPEVVTVYRTSKIEKYWRKDL